MAKAAPSAAASSAAPAAGTTPPGAAAAAATAASAPPKAGLKVWLPTIATLLLAPVCTWAVGQFVLIPQLQKQIAAAPTGAEAPADSGHAGGHGTKQGKDGKDGSPNYQFENVVVNLAGTMGTRYLKTTFLVTGAEPD